MRAQWGTAWPRLALHATALTFEHPIANKAIDIKAGLPSNLQIMGDGKRLQTFAITDALPRPSTTIMSILTSIYVQRPTLGHLVPLGPKADLSLPW